MKDAWPLLGLVDLKTVDIDPEAVIDCKISSITAGSPAVMRKPWKPMQTALPSMFQLTTLFSLFQTGSSQQIDAQGAIDTTSTWHYEIIFFVMMLYLFAKMLGDMISIYMFIKNRRSRTTNEPAPEPEIQEHGEQQAPEMPEQEEPEPVQIRRRRNGTPFILQNMPTMSYCTAHGERIHLFEECHRYQGRGRHLRHPVPKQICQLCSDRLNNRIYEQLNQ